MKARGLRRTFEAALVVLALAASTATANAAVYIPTKTTDSADGACNRGNPTLAAGCGASSGAKIAISTSRIQITAAAAPTGLRRASRQSAGSGLRCAARVR